MATITSFFATKTVDSVLGAFRTAIAELETVAQQQTDASTKAAEEARQAMDRQAAAEAEATRAVIIATKMKAVFDQ